MSRGKSPKSIPRTQQDVDRAYELGRAAGYDAGMNGALTLLLWTLRDRYGASDADLDKFARDFNYTLDSIVRGYVKESDLRAALKEEYRLTARIK